MAVIIMRGNAGAAWLPGIRAKAAAVSRRTVDYAAAAVMICAAGAALLELAAQIASFPVPVAVIAYTLMAGAVLGSLRRHRRTRVRHRPGPGNPPSAQR